MSKRKHYCLPLPGGRELVLGQRTLVMGILNVTPDSFSDGGLHYDTGRAIEAGLRMLDEGADILDIGGESTRPGSEPVGEDEELRRVLPVIEGLATRVGALLSIDTYRARTAQEAIDRGVSIINDISGLQYDPALGEVAAERRSPIILMHTRGRSSRMYQEAVYRDVVREVIGELGEAIARAEGAGIPRSAIILDPGFGFAKKAEHSFTLLAKLSRLAELDRPILSGPSRKSFLKLAVGERDAADRGWATAGAAAASVLLGAHIVRVHDVAAMVEVVRVADAVRAHG